MSPLDDELRRTLHSRAALLDPAADPFAAVEARARSMKRRRTAGVVAGAALAVGLIAGGIPVVTSALDSPARTDLGPANPTGEPSPSPSVDTATSRYALDPANPWDYRGDPMVIAEGNRVTFAQEWAVRQGTTVGNVRFDPLFGQVWESSQLAEVVYVATLKDTGTSYWGVVVATESGPEFVYEVPLPADATLLAAPLPGDEVARLLVVAAPEVTSVQYAPNGGDWAAAVSTAGAGAPGAFVKGLEGDPAVDRLRALVGSQVVGDIPAPDVETQGSVDGAPSNALDWPRRGIADDPLELRAVAGYATAVEADPTTVEYRALFAGDNDSGQKYVLIQAWTPSGRAQSFGWIETPGRAPEAVLQPEIPMGAQALALLLTDVPGSSVDQLVVVPAPGAGQVLYGVAASEYRPITGQDHLDGVVIIDRQPGEVGDKVKVIDGDGDLSAPPMFEGEVDSLLCGSTECA